MKTAIRFAFPVLLPAAWCLCAAAAQQPAQAPPKPPDVPRRENFLANYTKYEHRIPLRDGGRLSTAVYAPKDTSKAYPILLLRTPYSVAPYGADNYGQLQA